MSLNGYKTVLREARDEVVIHKSRFIGHAAPVSSAEEALGFLARIREEHRDATHNCYAYIIGRNAGIMRYSDDGEPSGTAGMPIIEVMKARGVVDCAVVVTRYFGGILLGGGGLVRAYSHATRLAVEKAQVITMAVCKLCALTCDYNQYGKIGSLIPECNGFLDDSDFGETVTLKFHMAEEDLSGFEKQLADATCGSVAVEVTGEQFFQIN